VEGRLFLSNDPEHGIPGVAVRIGEVETISNDTGYFLFPALSPGEYELSLESPTWDVAPGIDLPLRFTVEAGSSIKLDIPMVQPGSIGGYVLLKGSTEGGEVQPNAPIAEIMIELKSETGSDYTQTDGTGHFVFADLAPGTYEVIIRTESFPKYHETVGETQYEIDLAAGETISDIEFLVRTVEREIVIIQPTEEN
jgi:hypothetical protein